MFIKKYVLLCACSSIMLTALLIGCSKKDNTPATPAKDIQLAANTKYGSVITDNSGKTLYFFSLDANGSSSCTGGCLAAWPLFYKESPTLAEGLESEDFATITRSDGAKQTTYKGWPLYYYDKDLSAGDVNGEAVGSVWFLAKPDYSVMLTNAQLVGNNGKNYTSALVEGTGITQYLTDEYGRTLYAFSPDKFNKNNFTKPDFSNNPVWPIFEQTSTVKSIPSILDKASFDTTGVYGKTQLTFKGWPLYYFGKDSLIRGLNKGVSVPQPGVWPIVNNNSPVAPQ